MLSNATRRALASAIAGLAISIGLPIASPAHDLEPVSTTYSSNRETAYTIDENGQPVVVAWKAEHPTAVLIAIHGFGLHKGAFRQFAQRMQQDGVSTFALDVRGFGGWMRSDRGRKISFSDTMQDLSMLIQSARQEAPGTPIFLMGESMGGAIALAFAATNPLMVDGVISSVPSNELARPMRTIARIAASYILRAGGKVNLNNVLVKRVTDNETTRKYWRNDRDAKLNVTLRELLRFRGFMKGTRTMARQIDSLPVLIVEGKRDRLIKPAGTERLFNALSTKDKQLLVLEHGEHLTFEEGQFDESVLARLETWLSEHERQAVVASSG